MHDNQSAPRRGLAFIKGAATALLIGAGLSACGGGGGGSASGSNVVPIAAPTATMPPTSSDLSVYDVAGRDAGIPSSSDLIPQSTRRTPRDFGTPNTTVTIGNISSPGPDNVKWLSQFFGGCTLNGPPKDAGPQSAGCGPTAAAMAYAYVKGIDPTTDIVQDIMRRAGQTPPCGDAIGSTQLNQILNDKGVPSRYGTPFDAASLLTALQKKHPVIALVWYRSVITGKFIDPAVTHSHHYMLIVGMTQSPAQVIVNDPARYDRNYQFGAVGAYEKIPLADFVRVWALSDNLKGVEVGPESDVPQTPAGDFSLSVSPSTVSVSRGQQATYLSLSAA